MPRYAYNDVSGFAQVSHHQDWIFSMTGIPAPRALGVFAVAGAAVGRRRRERRRR